ncbi:acetate/propionate family kinase [Adlercreutzia caecimuris]|uniref:acetate/propionate family kinase n=1 Tax=Adlercreutzia caecimuris TaxID=671266 RepID=UPI001372DB47|nr:acetate kinase [Adlercreutzia caecimuris]MCI9208394.1 acetate kinase [Adlercreutzia caecimuris]NBJ66708.1 acetate kinase [Adlercreutzia caecimuris]
MNVLVINAGSSSLKYQLVNVETQEVLAKGICERVGSAEAFHKHGIDDNELVIDEPMEDHNAAMAVVLEALTSGPNKAIDSLDDIDAIGHRVVQGGKYFDRSVVIDDDVIAKIDELAELAPLHNKAALMGIEACRTQMPGKPMVAVFDTSFFQSIPPKAYMYPLPYELYEKYAIRKYGAHGTSHRYISERAAAFMDEPIEDLKLITCHLGNGCSISAIDHGVAVDTSMGLTPLDGLMMGTRCGAIDPAIVPFIMEKEGLSTQEVNDLMNKKSGLLGISGISNDLRSVKEASEAGDERAQLAYEMYSNSAKKYIGQYIAVMGGVDAIVLTAGVGENCEKMRRMIFAGLQPLGIKIDPEKNKLRGHEREISTDDSAVRIVVIPTNEEYMIARDTYQLVKEGSLEVSELA